MRGQSLRHRRKEQERSEGGQCVWRLTFWIIVHRGKGKGRVTGPFFIVCLFLVVDCMRFCFLG
jgi:hypothetical protein